ncbi:BON domain-containing protein [Marinimicrobium alkaliphilum]|uniref:BON domain-containing protein n=1 Tax=Marinimicrobium alkaliphilum TaxID=2202654 RepID=UPI000DBA2CE1|nr:BON domain-containing protein [Marinimicrobium alkaliphilum]
MITRLFLLSLLALTSALSLSACTSVLSATTREPITINPGKRTMGARIDDRQITTVVRVNINKAHEDLRTAQLRVFSYNGVVLLVGRVPNNELKRLAGETALKVTPVRQVNNELEVGDAKKVWSRSVDSWITTKVKSKLLFNRDVESGRIRVITRNNTVYLMGLVSRAEANRIAQIASQTKHVRKVVKVFEYID